MRIIVHCGGKDVQGPGFKAGVGIEEQYRIMPGNRRSAITPRSEAQVCFKLNHVSAKIASDPHRSIAGRIINDDHLMSWRNGLDGITDHIRTVIGDKNDGEFALRRIRHE